MDGVAYHSAEHFMMTAKALVFGDAETAELIQAAPHRREAKTLGREVRGFDEQHWAERRLDLVVTGNLAKFGQHPGLRDFLLGTGTRVLAEASPHDRTWGTGLAAGDDRAASPEHWLALMEVRHRLRVRAALPAASPAMASHAREGPISPRRSERRDR